LAVLDSYLDRASRWPFDWNGNECSAAFVGDWLRANGNHAADAYSGRFKTALGATRIIRREGGLVAIYDRALGARTDTPRRGDVGVVEAPTARGPLPTGAICTGDAWAVLTGDGISIGPARVLAAWRV
jgi:hypothetical protein